MAEAQAKAMARAPSRAQSGELGRTVLRVAWWSILLGLALEALLLVVVAYTGTQGESPRPFVADLAAKVSWAVIVCVGLSFGTAAGRGREAAMGFLGLISAPAGFAAARALHKGVGAALGLAAGGAAFPVLIALLKAVEYGFLGAALGRFGREARSLRAYLALGFATGLTFGTAILLTMIRSAPAPFPPADLASRGINELIFPVGCSLVLYAAEVMGKRLAA